MSSEHLQRSVYKQCHLQLTSYDERLDFLGLQRLKFCRTYSYLIFMFNLTHIIISSTLIQSLNFIFNSTRSHKFRLYINQCRKSVLNTFLYVNRIAPLWNSLPNNCFSNNTFRHLKRCINKPDFTNLLKG